MTDAFIINQETCSKCGMCAIICGTKAISYLKGEYPVPDPHRSESCFTCGQCMAVCPTASIIIPGLNNEDLFDLPEQTPDYHALFNLMVTRRSIRHFKDKPVTRADLEKVLAAVAQAPMGFPPHKTHATVVQKRETIAKMLPVIIKFYEDLTGWMRNPIIRYKIKKECRSEEFSSIQNHVIPLLKKRLPEMSKKGTDEITWGAPALMLFHAEKMSESHTIDACIALAYAFLAAHALGLGVTVSGLLPPAINQVTELQNMLGIPKDHEVIGAMMLGYPRYHYRRGIKRPLASINWV